MNRNKKRMAVGLLLFLILLIGLIGWNQKNRVEHTAVRQSREKQKQETVQKQEQTAPDSQETAKTTEETAKDGEDSRMNEELVQKEFIEIQHSGDYIRPVLGEQSNLVNQALQKYCTENQVQASWADCLNCTIPLDDPAKTVFFLELQNEEKAPLQAVYDPESRSVLIEPSEYTKEEILNESWSIQEAPAVRDVEE
ncbi:hypothetical protein [Sellimonas sp.]|uniref:hypothetical protein n=1 Tax=Sellimonas sp. TaxID=2021466 RepID=UPI00257DD6D7|nr:hypothetical protein [Sellimonas sp.]